jgi:hypothetical protein
MKIVHEDIKTSEYLYNPDHDIYATVRVIYPHEAEMIVNGQIKNRPISRKTVKRYSNAMRQNKWILNGESIIFSEGKLIDGQHRLRACVESKIPLTALVIEVGNPESFRTLDQGKKRGNSDILAIAGYVDTSNLAATLNILAHYDKTKGNMRNVVSPSGEIEGFDVESYAKEYEGIENSIRFADKMTKDLNIRKSCVACLHYILRRAEGTHKFKDYPSRVDVFFEQVFGGIGLEKRSATLALRNSYIKDLQANKARKMDLTAKNIIKRGVICWNNWVDGIQISSLRYSQESSIPKIKSELVCS